MVENVSLFIFFSKTKMLISHVQLHSTSIILSSRSLLYFLVYYNMHRPAFRPALYSCPFLGCKKNCKKPSGLTRHQATCDFNPKNQFVFPELDAFQPPGISPSPSPSPPRTPPQNYADNGVPLTPSHATPRRNVWLTKGRSGIYLKKHPYLDGKLA